MNIFEQYGLKEVANVTFYDIKTGMPVLFLDTLKVSTIEQTAENTEARGGWGNPSLITWDYNKEVNVTLEDALFSAASLRTIMGAGIEVASSAAKKVIDVNEELTIDANIPIGVKVIQGKIPNYYLNGFTTKSNIVEGK